MLIKTVITPLAILIFLAGCTTTPSRDLKVPALDQATNQITERSKVFLALQEALRENLEETSKAPALEPVVPEYDPLADVKVTLNVDNGDIQFVLQALTDQAGVNLLIHPTLVQSPHNISVHFTDVSASTVLKQVMRLADLAGKVKDNVLVVKPLEERIFHMDFLEMEQTTRFSAGGDVLGSTGVNGLSNTGDTSIGSSALTGEFKVEGSSRTEINPYEQLTEMLDILVGRSDNAAFNGVSGAGSVAEVGALSQVSTAKQSDTPLYSLNRMTGTLYVQAKPSVMETVAKLVNRYKEVLGRQIVIEAQIMEVALSDDFQYGIDWAHLNHEVATAFGPTGSQIGGVETTFPTGENEHVGRSLTIPGQVLSALGQSFGSVSYIASEFAATITLLQGFGDVTVLSNPTIRSKHGQPAIMSVGTSTSYIAQSGSVALSGVGTTVTQNLQTSSVFDGLVLGVVPFIADGGSISLSIHPIQSNVDPASLNLVTIGNTAITLPRVALKEISTLLKMQDGDVVILGGLIDQAGADIEEQVPGFGRIPLLGYLFKKKQNNNRVRELVVVLKATII